MKALELINRAALNEVLERGGLDGILATSPKNVFYLSGSPVAREGLYDHLPHRPGDAQLSAVLVTADGKSHLVSAEEHVAVNDEEAWAETAGSYTPYSESPIAGVARVLDALIGKGGRIGVEAEYLTLGFFDQLRALAPGLKLVAADRDLEWMRSLKTPGELEQLKQSADLLDETFLEVFTTIKEGDTEGDFHELMIDGATRRGAEYCRGFVAVGDTNDLSFYTNRSKVLKAGEIVHTDYAGYLNGYPSNLSRLGVVGAPSNDQRRKYANLIAIEQRIVEYMRPGRTGADVFAFARRACYELGYIHTAAILGHNLGLGYHDRPMLTAAETMPLESGNHVALEPLIEWTFHIQDQVQVENSGSRIISDKFDTSELFVIA